MTSATAVISGIGETSYHELPDLSEIGICVEAATPVVADAGTRGEGHRRVASRPSPARHRWAERPTARCCSWRSGRSRRAYAATS